MITCIEVGLSCYLFCNILAYPRGVQRWFRICSKVRFPKKRESAGRYHNDVEATSGQSFLKIDGPNFRLNRQIDVKGRYNQSMGVCVSAVLTGHAERTAACNYNVIVVCAFNGRYTGSNPVGEDKSNPAMSCGREAQSIGRQLLLNLFDHFPSARSICCCSVTSISS